MAKAELARRSVGKRRRDERKRDQRQQHHHADEMDHGLPFRRDAFPANRFQDHKDQTATVERWYFQGTLGERFPGSLYDHDTDEGRERGQGGGRNRRPDRARAAGAGHVARLPVS